MANIISCPTCNKQVSEIATNCPNCGEPRPGGRKASQKRIAAIEEKTRPGTTMPLSSDFEKYFAIFVFVFLVVFWIGVAIF